MVDIIVYKFRNIFCRRAYSRNDRSPLILWFMYFEHYIELAWPNLFALKLFETLWRYFLFHSLFRLELIMFENCGIG